MKLVVRTFFVLLILLIGGLVFLFLLTEDVVTTKYPTVQAARDDELFGKGWLPDILPSSARDIRVSNNLDLNTSEGEFFFDAKESGVLKSRLGFQNIPRGPFENWNDYVDKRQKAGFEVGSHSDAASDWIFFCKYQRGECDYVMGLRKR